MKYRPEIDPPAQAKSICVNGRLPKAGRPLDVAAGRGSGNGDLALRGLGHPGGVEAAWADIGITPSHHLELPNWEAVKLAVARGHGVAGCSQFMVAAELQAGSLGVIRLRGWKVRRTISIPRHREAVLTPSAREFVAMLHARWHRRSQRLRRDGSSPRR